MISPTRVVTTPSIVLRVVEVINSIAAIVVLVTAPSWLYINESRALYLILTGASSALVCLVYLWLYFYKKNNYLEKDAKIELVITFLWWVFWLAAAAVWTDEVVVNASYDYSDGHLTGTMVFSWIAFILWTISAVLCVLNIRNARNLAAVQQPAGFTAPGTYILPVGYPTTVAPDLEQGAPRVVDGGPNGAPPPTRPDTASLVLSSVPSMVTSTDPVLQWVASRPQPDYSTLSSGKRSQTSDTSEVPDHVKSLEFKWSDARIIKPLGSGSFGKVFLAEVMHAPVALKVLVDAAALTESAAASRALSSKNNSVASSAIDSTVISVASKGKLVGEVAVMASLRHPNVANLVGFCLDPPALTLEYYSRGSLYDILLAAAANPAADSELNWKRRLNIAAEAAAGMLHLHTRSPQILHRDLKSPNLMIAADWTVKVADMGLSKLLDDSSLSATTAGGAANPRWLAPELLRGGAATAASDVFSFGYIMWELLVWTLPWSDTSVWLIVGKVLEGGRPAVPPPAELPGFGPRGPPASLGDYMALMRRCWEQDPAKRPEFGEVATELRRLTAAAE